MKCLWMDANVILRFLTGDPPEMAAKALSLMRRAEGGEIRLRLSPIVLAEVVWVLRSFYRFPGDRIASVLVSLINTEGIIADDADLLSAALTEMTVKNVDFIDAYLAEIARAAGEAVCSFDEDFERLRVERVNPE